MLWLKVKISTIIKVGQRQTQYILLQFGLSGRVFSASAVLFIASLINDLRRILNPENIQNISVVLTTKIWFINICDCYVIRVNTNLDKKLRYGEQHSASVVHSWCTLSHFSGENLLMANQPILCDWPW